ncbi:uncharacterized protein LOC121991090 [Zingiber officinale]|uniref:uncharacterized protein LOC121991090 n=1 Tax=Zingiber officinale TaxID=94328 RepID=UPI001C4CE85C|nr:uncharacterized protein LOC121991090 [Zingiber officinale]
MEEQRAAARPGGRPHPDLAGSNAQQPGQVGELGEAREAENCSNTAIREIGMISEGSTDGDSGRARKSHVRRLEVDTIGCNPEQATGPVISFGPQDLEGLELPHDNTLIIKAIIANSRVARVFIDIGSSVNILFRTAFKEMQIDATELQPVATSLYGFTGNEVGEVKGEKKVSQRCYIDMVRVEARKNQRMQDGGVHAVQEKPLPMAEEPIPWEEVQLYAERPESLTRIASDLPPLLKKELIQCLIRNRDVFAWSTEELPGVKPEVAEHKLHLLTDSRPVKQKKRNFSVDQNKIIRAEVDQLRKAGHVREVQFPSWLSNVVLVKKPNNKWRVCIDIRDLNRASPKDCYPLPRIDQMVDSTAGCERICMLDAY